MNEERLQKILARAGISSRRKAEELIQAGRVRLDGKIVTELGTKASRDAKVEVDGQRIMAEPLCYGVLHKPRAMVTTLSDPEGRPTIREILAKVGLRVIPVGRLDFNTSGALLFTNDGDFAQELMHARSEVPKVYVATVRGPVDERMLAKYQESIEIDGSRTRPAEVRILRHEGLKCWLEITLREGKNRQVRRLAEHAGTPLIRLARISHAGITSEDLRPGEFRLLTIDELKELKKSYGVPKKIRSVLEVLPSRPVNRQSSFGRRAPRSEERGSFEKRGPSEGRSFEKRGPSEGRSFEQRSVGAREAGAPRSSRERSAIEKRGPSEVRSFEKRGPSEGRSFEKRSAGEGRSFEQRGEATSRPRGPREAKVGAPRGARPAAGAKTSNRGAAHKSEVGAKRGSEAGAKRGLGAKSSTGLKPKARGPRSSPRR